MIVTLLLTIIATGASGLMVHGFEGNGLLAGRESILQWGVQVTSMAPVAVTSSEDSGPEREDEETDHREDENVGGTAGDAESAAPDQAATRSGCEAAEEAWEHWHALLADLSALLVFVHIAGAIASSLVHRKNLVCAMITGNKRAE